MVCITFLMKYCPKQRMASVHEKVRQHLFVLCTVQKTRQYLSDLALWSHVFYLILRW